MSKRVYLLTIEYDPDTEDIEYVMETVEHVDDGHVQLTQIGTVNLEDYFDEDVLKEILQCYEVGEA